MSESRPGYEEPAGSAADAPARWSSPPGLRSRAPGGRGEPRARTSYGPGPSSPRSRRPVPRSRPASQPGGLRVAGPIRLPGPPAGRGQWRARLAPAAREGEPERGRSGTRQPPPRPPAVVRHASAWRDGSSRFSARQGSSRPKPVITSSPGARWRPRRGEHAARFRTWPEPAGTEGSPGRGCKQLAHARQGAAAMAQDRSQPLPETTVPHREAGSRSGRSPGSSWVWHSRASTFVVPAWLGTTAIPAQQSQHSTPRRARCSASSARARWSQVLTVPTGRSRLWAISS